MFCVFVCALVFVAIDASGRVPDIILEWLFAGKVEQPQTVVSFMLVLISGAY